MTRVSRPSLLSIPGLIILLVACTVLTATGWSTLLVAALEDFTPAAGARVREAPPGLLVRYGRHMVEVVEHHDDHTVGRVVRSRTLPTPWALLLVVPSLLVAGAGLRVAIASGALDATPIRRAPPRLAVPPSAIDRARSPEAPDLPASSTPAARHTRNSATPTHLSRRGP